MKFWKAGLLPLILMTLLACTDESAQAQKDSQASSHSQTAIPVGEQKSSSPAETPSLADMPSGEGERSGMKSSPPDEDELRQADRMIAFSNRARELMRRGVYTLADILRNNAVYYRENWTLPARPKLPAKHNGDSRLKAPEGIFSQAEEEQLTKSLKNMDSALNEIITYYRNLEKYLNDSSIIDDGKKGLELSEKLLQSHAQYQGARKSWMELVEAKADAAEAILLYGHPLQRQILAARNFFAQMREIDELADSEGNKRKELETLRQNLDSIIAEAGKPPFQAPPSLERLYRSFLKSAREYFKILDRGILEGLHGVQKRELNAAGIKCRDSYNNFVSAANKLADRGAGHQK